MQYMLLLKADESFEAGVPPTAELVAEMCQYNEEMKKAGVLVSAEWLQPSSKGARVRFSGTQRTVVDGPFAETKELIAGFWLINVKSREEALDWVRRCPRSIRENGEIEMRKVFEADDFGPAFTPKLREQEERLRAQSAARSQAG